jgi:hypothetical protein
MSDWDSLSPNTPESSARPVMRHPRTASRVFNGEAVIISPAENVVRMLNPVGSRIWELCDGSHTLDQIATVLTQEFDVDEAHARQSVDVFVTELAAKDLVTWQG